MILETAIINIVRNLEDICNKDGRGISSHVDIKEKGLSVLLSLIQKAPDIEYRKLLQSDSCEIILGFTMHVLCRLAKDDRSREIRARSLEVMEALVDNLGRLHQPLAGAGGQQAALTARDVCSIKSVIIAMPGVTSVLFKLIVEDIKLPKHLLTAAVRTLTRFLTVAFLPCDHPGYNTSQPSQEEEDVMIVKLEGQNLVTTCDNLAVRIGYLVNYVSSHQNELPKEVLHETLKMFEEIVKITRPELLARTLKSIIRYIALISSTVDDSYGQLKREIQVRLMLIIDNIKVRIEGDNIEDGGEQLDSVIYSSLFQLLDDLEERGTNMLMNERYSTLTMLSGLLMLLPEDTLTSFLELVDRRDQLLRCFYQLTEFKTQQALLFLTNNPIGEQALESRYDATRRGVYTIEKQFTYLNEKEVKVIGDCCRIIGLNSDWSFLNDMFITELNNSFNCPSKLFITNLLMKGCLERKATCSNPYRFTSQMIDCYLDKIQTEYTNLKLGDGEIYSSDILKLVIAIESLMTLVDIHLKFNEDESNRIVILKDLLCPVLNWCSSSSRAVSEAALNTLAQISLSYGHNSMSSLIEQNIDYVVDGCCRMLDNFACNTEVTNVLAITFRLSSKATLFYFKDVYEKIFILLRAYHYTEKSKSIALLFYRTLSIINDWIEAETSDRSQSSSLPLTSKSSARKILHELDIDRRIEKLGQHTERVEEIHRQMERMEMGEKEQQQRELDEIETAADVAMLTGQNDDEQQQDDHDDDDDYAGKKAKSTELLLTERILKQCIGLMSSHFEETKIFAMKCAACGFKILKQDEDSLLPLVHQLWPPLVSRLNGDYRQNLEVNLCAFDCLLSMASASNDFIKRRTLDAIIPKLCHFLESQAPASRSRKDYDPYCMTLAFKCQLRLLGNIGELAYHIELNYDCLWRIIRVAYLYLDPEQVASLREASRRSLRYMMALDADCVWYYGRQSNHLDELPFGQIFIL